MSETYAAHIISRQSTFGLRAFVDVYQDLAPFLDEPCAVCIELTHPTVFQPDGMLPFVALVRDLIVRGWTVDYVPPEDPLIASYWRTTGWHQALQMLEPPNPRSARTYIPVVGIFDTPSLNSAVLAARDVLATTSEFPVGVLNAVEWAVGEVTDNVLVHSGTSGWLQVVAHPTSKKVDLVVVDCGIGIPSTLRQRYPDIIDDKDLLKIATERGTTRDSSIGQGNGLAGCLRITDAVSGGMSILSRNAWFRRNFDGVTTLQDISNFPGSIVTMTLRTDQMINLQDALWGYSPPSAFEISHLSESGIMFLLANEQTSYHNRASGGELAIKLMNMMTENPGERVVIDFSDIGVTSASFLDEFLAKLASRIGVATFFRRVSVTNANDFVERTLNEVLRQRLGTN